MVPEVCDVCSGCIAMHTFHQELRRHQTHWRWTHQHRSIHLHRFKYVHQIQFMFWLGSSFPSLS